VRSADGGAAVLRRFTGLLWVFMGAANSCAKLYDNEVQAVAKKYPDQSCADYRAVARAKEQERKGEGVGYASCRQLMRTSLLWFMRPFTLFMLHDSEPCAPAARRWW
jgi:hypothetical protein